jgi:hypothetical protein
MRCGSLLTQGHGTRPAADLRVPENAPSRIHFAVVAELKKFLASGNVAALRI